MRPVYLILFFIILIDDCVVAQGDVSITVKAGTSILDYFPYEKRFKYNDFIDGEVVFNNGTIAKSRLNYNVLLGHIQFISARNDTLSLSNEQNIEFISIDSDTFYFNNGYLERVYRSGKVLFAQRNYVKYIGSEKQGAYGMTSSTSSITSYSSLQSEGSYHNLVVAEDVKLRATTEYYISYNQSKFNVYRRANLLRMLPQHKKEVKAFIKQNKIDFNNKENLIQLSKFIERLN